MEPSFLPDNLPPNTQRTGNAVQLLTGSYSRLESYRIGFQAFSMLLVFTGGLFRPNDQSRVTDTRLSAPRPSAVASMK